MKNIIAVVSMATMLNVLGNQNPRKNYSTEPAAEANFSKEDTDLMTRAQRIFEALPLSAESDTNKTTAEKIKLGKLLYFDTRLSMTGKNSYKPLP
jgi:cytochrome c peroxidase